MLILLGDPISTTYLEVRHSAGNFAPEPVSVADLFAGALLPGLLLVGLYGTYALWRLRRDDGGDGTDTDATQPPPISRA